MTTPDQRLAELGLTLPAVATPVAAYTPYVVAGSTVYVSGQLPFVDGALTVTGKVGSGEGLVSAEEAAAQARIAALNALAALSAAAGGLQNVERVVKVVGFVASDREFIGQPAVINGASELIAAVLGDAGVHARSAVGVAVLPLNSPVEVELVAVLR